VKFLISGDQISFYERFGYVALESFFSKTAVQKLSVGISSEIKRRRTVNPNLAVVFHERDLALSSQVVRSVLFSSSLAKGAFEFIRQRPLRYAYDQILHGFSPGQAFPIPETVCVGPILLNALICIYPPTCSEAVMPVQGVLSAPPLTEGGVSFFSTRTLIAPKADFDGEYILLGYGGAHLLYRHEERDPCLHTLKKYGYMLNDSLKQTTHPSLLHGVLR
jgi:hypothetical protein